MKDKIAIGVIIVVSVIFFALVIFLQQLNKTFSHFANEGTGKMIIVYYETILNRELIKVISDSLDSVGWEHKMPEYIPQEVKEQEPSPIKGEYNFYYFPTQDSTQAEVCGIDLRYPLVNFVYRNGNWVTSEEEIKLTAQKFEEIILPKIERETIRRGLPDSVIYKPKELWPPKFLKIKGRAGHSTITGQSQVQQEEQSSGFFLNHEPAVIIGLVVLAIVVVYAVVALFVVNRR